MQICRTTACSGTFAVCLLHCCIVSEEDVIAKSWQMPLLHFTSKRRGSQQDNQHLARSVR